MLLDAVLVKTNPYKDSYPFSKIDHIRVLFFYDY